MFILTRVLEYAKGRVPHYYTEGGRWKVEGGRWKVFCGGRPNYVSDGLRSRHLILYHTILCQPRVP